MSNIPDFTKYGLFQDAERKNYLTDEESYEINHDKKYIKFCDAAQHFFFNGGRLEDQNLTLKNRENLRKIYAALQVLLRSFAPPHNVKIATVAKLLYENCDIITHG